MKTVYEMKYNRQVKAIEKLKQVIKNTIMVLEKDKEKDNHASILVLNLVLQHMQSHDL